MINELIVQHCIHQQYIETKLLKNSYLKILNNIKFNT